VSLSEEKQVISLPLKSMKKAWKIQYKNEGLGAGRKYVCERTLQQGMKKHGWLSG
jgi:hypothetical protein